MAITGLERARQKMRELPQAVQDAVRKEMEAIASEMVTAMKAAAPSDEGDLVASIGWTWGKAPEGSIGVASLNGAGGTRLSIYAGSPATIVYNSRGIAFQNAKLQEFGTKKMGAQPYFFPIVRTFKRIATRRINAAARKAALKVWGK